MKLLLSKNLIFFLLLTIFFFSLSSSTSALTLTGSGSVNVNAQVNFTLTIKVYPERRIPLTGHWMNQNVVEIRNIGSTTPLITQVVENDAQGVGVLNPINVSVLPPGNYDIAVKGYSHLRKVYPNYSFVTNTLNYDLTTTGEELEAGDTSIVIDNYVNSLDISYLSNNLYSGNLKSDLNRDGIVNSLDLSNQIRNLYKYGAN